MLGIVGSPDLSSAPTSKNSSSPTGIVVVGVVNGEAIKVGTVGDDSETGKEPDDHLGSTHVVRTRGLGVGVSSTLCYSDIDLELCPISNVSTRIANVAFRVSDLRASFALVLVQKVDPCVLLGGSRPCIGDLSFKCLSPEQKDSLKRDLSNEEIKRDVWDCGEERAWGPDGFTFKFFKTFWDTIQPDVVRFVCDFFQLGYFPKGCNSSFIALIPKVGDAKFVFTLDIYYILGECAILNFNHGSTFYKILCLVPTKNNRV
ncbi:hypothetical protein Tco_0556259 [Tanacetum coccineum]